ncbi:hypothetical protein ScPMuIL_010078 [Solemya velum]
MSPTADPVSEAISHSHPGKAMDSEMFQFKYNSSLNNVHGGHILLKTEFSASERNLRSEFFNKEECLYSHQVFVGAAKLFDVLKHDTKDERENIYLKKKRQAKDNLAERLQHLPQMEFKDDGEKRLTLELAFTTLKYQTLLEDILHDCCFLSHYPEFLEDYSLLMVMLCDFQSRKFQFRTPLPGETIDPLAQQVENAINQSKKKLNAALARHRIKASVTSVESLLPMTVRNNEEIKSKMPVYLWVNQWKTSLSEMVEMFKEENFSEVASTEMLDGRRFCIDTQCHDLLIFSSEWREYLLGHKSVLSGNMVRQNKSSCVAPHSVRYLIGDDDDVIHVNMGSGITTAQLSSLMHKTNGQIWGFNADHPTHVQEKLDKFGAKNVKIVQESFLDIEPDDNRFRGVKAILVTANCSKSGIANPVDFIVNEGEDMKILKDLSIGETDLTRLGELVGEHGKLVRHAMKFHKVQAVVYTTRSKYEAENENIITKAVEFVNMAHHKKFPYRVIPPLLPFSGEDIDNSIGISDKYIKFQPSEKINGCFVAVVTREPEDAKEVARDVLARAAAKGLLGGKERKEATGVVNMEHSGNGNVDSKEDHKLLRRRTQRSPKRLRTAVSAPDHNFPHKANLSRTSFSYGHTAPKSKKVSRPPAQSTTSIGARLHSDYSQSRVDKKRDKFHPHSEHTKIIKHPAPFR